MKGFLMLMLLIVTAPFMLILSLFRSEDES